VILCKSQQDVDTEKAECRKEDENKMKLTLREWRKAKEIKIADMAKMLDVHPNTYQSWEEDPGKISVDNAVKIAAYLDVPFDDVLFATRSTKC